MQNFSFFISSCSSLGCCSLPNLFCIISTLQSKCCYQTNLWIEEDKSILFLEANRWHSQYKCSCWSFGKMYHHIAVGARNPEPGVLKSRDWIVTWFTGTDFHGFVMTYHSWASCPISVGGIKEKVGKGGKIKKAKTTCFFCNRIKLCSYCISKVEVVGEFLVFLMFILLC